MLPTATDLEYFLEITKMKNLSRAADRLGITQPSLSLSLQRLEHVVGTQLCIRSKTGIRLTQAGRNLGDKIQIFLDEWSKLKSSVKDEAFAVQGRFSLGVHPSVAIYSLKYFLPELFKSHPGIEVQLIHDLSRKITEQIISARIDLGIVINPVRHPDLVIRQMFTDTVGLWRSKDLSAANKDVLIYDPDLRQSQTILEKLNRKGTAFRRHIHSSNLEVINSLLRAGTGYAILPARVAKESGGGTDTLVCEPQWPTFSDRICLVYRLDTPKTAGFKTLLEATYDWSLTSHPNS